VNGILDAAAASDARCEIWTFSVPRQAIDALMSVGGVFRGARDAVASVAQLPDLLWKRMALGMMKARASSLALPVRSDLPAKRW
jgi:hypothetical protein